MKKKVKYLLGVTIAMILASCSTADTPEPAPSEPQTPVAEEIILPEASLDAISEKNIERSTDFAINMLKAALEIGENNNMVLSPMSAMGCISMAINGYGDRTPYLRAFGFEESDEGLKELNEFNYHILTALPKLDPEKVKLNFSNSYWCKNGFSILPFLAEKLEKYYNVIDGGHEPNGSDGQEAINNFIKEKSCGLLPKFLEDPLSDEVRAALINTLYFKGEWTTKFDENNTFDADFYNLDGSTGEVKMMYNMESYEYAEIDGISSVTLPYGNGNFSMTIFCPAANSDLNFNNMVSMLTPETVRRHLKERRLSPLELFIPSFECGVTPNIEKVLTKIGAWDSNPFTILQENGEPYKTAAWEIIQKNKIKVNENGTEGASATMIIVSDSMMDMPRLVINRPFVYLVREESTGIVLFEGAMTNF